MTGRKATNRVAAGKPLQKPGGTDRPGRSPRVWQWFLLSGAFFVLHLMLFRQRELELRGISIHLALLGLLSGLLLGAARSAPSPARSLDILPVALASLLLSWGLTLPDRFAWAVWIGWPVLLAVASALLCRRLRPDSALGSMEEGTAT